MTSKKSCIYCNNCGKIGHLFHQCKVPITSIGVITVRYINNNVEVLMIRRKDSLAFVDFIRGKYNLDNIEYLNSLFEKMTKFEHDSIKSKSFNELWKYLWGRDINNQYKNEEKVSCNKFNSLKKGIIINNKTYCLNSILDNIKKYYDEPEWGFPKGRRNFQENDITCALREFEEETGYLKDNILIVNNILPIEETFTSCNNKSYKHKYFIGLMKNNNIPSNIFQTNEISKISWVNANNVNDYIRNYNIEKKKIINIVNNLLKSYKLYI